MIIIGYQGVGKSTLAATLEQYIDFESSVYFIDGKRPDNWYKMYARAAKLLSDQGYDVFVSSHDVVRKELREIGATDVITITPALELKSLWITKLAARYKLSTLEKDYKAWKNAEACYEQNIEDIRNSGFTNIILDTMEYELSQAIDDGRSFLYLKQKSGKHHIEPSIVVNVISST